MKSKREIEIFLNEKFNGLSKELIEFIFQDDDTKKSNTVINSNPYISDTDNYVDFRYPFETDEEKFTIRFTKGNRCISAYYNYELIFDGNTYPFCRWYMGKQTRRKLDVCKSKEKDIKFTGSIYFLAKIIFKELPSETVLNESKIKDFIVNTVKPYLIENVFYKDEN